LKSFNSFRVFSLSLLTLFSVSSPALAIDFDSGRSEVLAYSGSFNSSIFLPSPTGVGGLQPSLELHYATGMGTGLYGYGWTLNVAKIERDIKGGVPGYTDADTFILTMNGVRSSLTNVGGNEYRLKREGIFLKLLKNGNSWEVRDKNGTASSKSNTATATVSFFPTSGGVTPPPAIAPAITTGFPCG